jgi:Tol biopolymer transport system component
VTALPAYAFDGAKAQRLTGSGNAGRAIAMSRDGSWVAYPVVESNGESLWVRKVTANASIQIVPPAPVRFGGLNFSPDGSFIYYTVYSNSPTSQLYRVPVLGGPPAKLAGEGIDSIVAFSPDGHRMAYARARSNPAASMIYLSDLDGSQEQLLVERKDPNGFFLPSQGTARLAWSPDGKVLAIPIVEQSPETAIGIINIATREVTTLGSARWSALYALEWLPDGRGLLAAGDDRSGLSLSSQIWQIDYPAGTRRQVTHDLNDYLGISVSADARTFAASSGEYSSTLWIADGPSLAQVSEITTEGKYNEGGNGLSWTADDRLIYTSTESGNQDLWEIDVQTRVKRQLTTNTASDYLPAVSPDDRSVAFVSNRSGQARIWVMERDGANARALSSGPNDLFRTWGPDGTYVVFDRRFAAEEVSFVVSYPEGEERPFVDEPRTGGVPARRFNPRSISRQGLIGGFTLGTKGREIVIVSPTRTILRRFDSPGSNGRPLTWTPDGLAVTAVNPRDHHNVWSFPADGGTPRRLTAFTDGLTHRIAWSRDGKRLALSRGHDRYDVILFTAPDR